MPILEDPKTLPQFVESGQKLMGLDLGTKTIGLAVSDTMFKIATPLETIKRSKFTKDTQALRAFEETHNIGALVIGLPLNMDGTTQPITKRSEGFRKALEKEFSIPTLAIDERLTTWEACQLLKTHNPTKDKKTKATIDAQSAQLIVQQWLDHPCDDR